MCEFPVPISYRRTDFPHFATQLTFQVRPVAVVCMPFMIIFKVYARRSSRGVGAKAYFLTLLAPNLELASRVYLRQWLRASAFPNPHFLPINTEHSSLRFHAHPLARPILRQTIRRERMKKDDEMRDVLLATIQKTGGNVIDDIMSRIFIVEPKRHNIFLFIFRRWIRVFVYRLEFGKQQLK